MNGIDTDQVYPKLVAFLAIVVTAELLRFNFEWFNIIYCQVCGPLMRTTEIKKVNGVVYYLLGKAYLQSLSFLSFTNGSMYRLYYCIVLLSKRSCGVIYHLFILGGPYRQHLWKTMGKIHDTVQWKIISRVLRSSRIRITRNICLFWSTFLLSSVLQYRVKPSAIDHLFDLWWPCSRHFRSPWKLSV